MKHQSLILAILLATHNAYAGAATGGATEPTQIMNNIELILSNTQLMEEVSTSIKQLQTMYTDLKKLQGIIENSDSVVEQLLQLNEAVRYGQALAYNAEDLANKFANHYKDFETFLREGQHDTEFAKDRYQQWSRSNLDSIHGALRAANLQSKYFQTEASTIKEIEHHAKTAEGRDQLLQAGIEMAGLQARQLIELRQLIAADMQMQAAYQASLVDRQAEKDAQYIQAISGDIRDNMGEETSVDFSNMFKK